MRKLLFSSLALLLLAGCINTGTGTANDTIYQVQYDGLVWQTYDVWLTNDHPTERSNAIYCIEESNPELITQAKAALDSKQKCRIEYHNEFFVAPWRCNSDTIIDKMECA